MDGLKTAIQNLETNQEEMKDEVKDLKSENKHLHEKIYNLEATSRRKNIIVQGLKEKRGETWDDSKKVFRKILVEDL